MEENEKKSDTNMVNSDSSCTSHLEPGLDAKAEENPENAPFSTIGKRKLKDTCSPSKKKGSPMKDGRSSSLSIAGPSTSRAKWSSSSSSEREECPVCRKQLGRKPIAVPDCCNHSFCYECINAWVTKAKSNCPMDRKDIKLLKIYDKGKFVTTEAVEPKVPEEEEIAPEDEGEICPDCGWIGIRPSIGVCLHCMFHHDHPWPVEDCPQCMEAESNASDDEWEPATYRSRRRVPVESSDIEVMSSEEDSPANSSDSEDEGDTEKEDDGEPEVIVAAPVRRRAPVRRKTKRKVVRKKRRKTATKRKTTTKRKRKTKTRSTPATTTRRKKRKTTRKKKVSLRARRNQARRQIAPSDSAKSRLAKLLGLKPPKDPRQFIPRGCKPKPVTPAQRAAAAASSSSVVMTRPVGSLNYYHRALPTLHLFGGDELDYFPSDSDSERGGGNQGGAAAVATRHAQNWVTSEVRGVRRLNRQKIIHAPQSAPSSSAFLLEPVDILGSILESQAQRRTKFDICPDGSILMHSSKNNTKYSETPFQSPRLDLKKIEKLASQRPSNPSSSDKNPSSTANNIPDSNSGQVCSSHNTTECGVYQDPAVATSASSSFSSLGNNQLDNVNSQSSSSLLTSNIKNKPSPESQDEDEEIDIYSDIPSSDIARDVEENSPLSSPKLKTPPALDEEHFDTSMASYGSNDTEGEEEEEEDEGNERMIIDETDAVIQSPPTRQEEFLHNLTTEPSSTLPTTSEPYDTREIPLPPPTDGSPCYGADSSNKYGSSSPCYGGGSPSYTAADAVAPSRYQDDLYSGLPTPVDVCPNLFTYSAASMDIARSCGAEEEERDRVPVDGAALSPAECPMSPESQGYPEVLNTLSEIFPSATRANVVKPLPNADNAVEINAEEEKITRRHSLVEEIFGSDSEDCDVSNYELPPPPVPSSRSATIHMTGLEGLDTETISEAEEEANFNDPEEYADQSNDALTVLHNLAALKRTNSSKTDADYEEGEIVEDRSRTYTEAVDVCSSKEADDPPANVLDSPIVPTSPVSPDPSMMDNTESFENNTPLSPVANEERPPSRSVSASRRRDNKPKSPERRRGRDRESRSKKNSNKSDLDKLNSANIEWKKLSKNSKERNYRDGKAKENVSHDRNEKKERSNREDRRGKKKKEKRKDLERYDVRKVINERSRREAERRRRDKFGRDISREKSHSQSPSHSPRPLTHHQPRHRHRTPEAADYQVVRSRSRRYRHESWSSNHSHYSMSGSSRGSSTQPPVRHQSNSSRHRQHHHSRDEDRGRSGEQQKIRARSLSRSLTRSCSREREVARHARRERSLSYIQATPGMVTIVSGHERMAAQGMKATHGLTTAQLPESVISAAIVSSNNSALKKKADKPKDKKKKEGKKKKKEHHRHVLAPLAPAGSITNNNPPATAVNITTLPAVEKKKKKREKSPPASKEVFASGDNILVSVNFNKPTLSLQSAASLSLSDMPKTSKDISSNLLSAISNLPPTIQKRIAKESQQLRGDVRVRNAPKRLAKRNVGRKPSDVGNLPLSPRMRNNEPMRPAPQEKQQASPQPPLNKRRDDGKRRKRIAEIAAKRKPVAIIDLESSPFAERVPSPAEVITLSDNESRLSTSSRSSRRSSVDGRRARRRNDKEEQRPRKQRKPPKSDIKSIDRQISMIAPILSSAPTVALGPKTPPEPQIKFSINAKPQLRTITNPLQDEDDDAEIDQVTGGSTVTRDKSEMDLNASSNAGLATSTSGIPTLIVSSHSAAPVFRGPNTPPEPCLPQSRSSSCSTTTKLDLDAAKVNSHAPQSPVDAKSPDVYDPFEPTKSPSSDASSSEQQPDMSQPIDEDLSEGVHTLTSNAGNLTPGSISDNSMNSSRLLPQAPESPTPDTGGEHTKHQSVHEEESTRKDDTITKKMENSVPSLARPHHNTAKLEDQPARSPAPPVSVSAADITDTTEMKPTSTTTIILQPPVVGAQELFTTLPPNVANILCAPQHQGFLRPQINATIAAVPILLSAPSILGLRVSQHTILASNQHQQQAQATSQPAQQQQQQPDTTTTTDVVDMELESPYSPASSEGDDLFEPPDKPPSPTYPPRKAKQAAKSSARVLQKRNTDKFDTLFNQSTPLKKEASSTSGNRSNSHPTRGSHGHRSTNKVRHNRSDKADNKSSKVGSTQKSRGKNANNEKTKSGKKEISIKMDEDQLKILDDLPSSAVEMQVKEKFLKKLNRQERVVEEVKLALKPHYTKKLVNKEEYKEILRRSVPKICHNKTGEINPIRIRMLVGQYVKKFRYIKKKDPSKPRAKADKQR